MTALRLFLPLDSIAVSLGADDVVDALKFEAAKRKYDLTIVRTGSRGMHWLEPLLEIERSGSRVGYANVAESDAAALLDAIAGDGDHEKFVGPVEEIPFFKNQTRLIFARCGITDPVSAGDYAQHGGFAGLDKALAMDGGAVCEEVMQSGLRGRGGAGFPAGIKWKTVAGAKADQKYIVVNADEGDSGTFADRMIMEGDPFTLIEGMIIAGVAVGATQGYIYLRSEYPVAAQVLNEALSNARKAGVLGANVRGSGKAFDISVFMGAGAYICGEETSLLNSLEGKRGEVRAKPPLPALEGLFGKPTLVHETAFGITLGELVNDIGGGPFTDRPVRAAQIGGPLGAYLPPRLFGLKMDYETMLANGAGVGHGGIVVFDDSVDLLEQARYAFEFCVEESCGKCTPCRVGSVRGVETVDRIKTGVDREKNLKVLGDLCELMVDGSLCAMGGMTPIPVQSALKHFPEDFGVKPARQAAE